MTNTALEMLSTSPWVEHVQARPDAAGWLALGGALVDLDPGVPAHPAGNDVLSADASAMVAELDMPIAAWPTVRGRDTGALRHHVRALNDLIVGPDASSPAITLLRSHLGSSDASGLDPARMRLGFVPLWQLPELADIERLGPLELEAEWRRRMLERVPQMATVIRDDQRCATFWRDMPGGDFDVQGRGLDYTAGMRAFPACRAIGVQTLLELLGAFDPGPRVYLDVLGGEGYVWRLLEANRRLARRQLLVCPTPGATHQDPLSAVSTMAMETLWRAVQVNRDAVVMTVTPPDAASPGGNGSPQGCMARLLGFAGARALVSDPFALSAPDLVRWLDGRRATPAGTDGASAASRALRPFLDADEEERAPMMITNDVSRHMFYRAGLWGVPTREDARRLSRTFRAEQLDGVLCAYGTHHIDDIYGTLYQSYLILKPEGRIVVHDFFDRGPVGRWFHEIVDRYSNTGHGMAHVGPVEMAVCLFRAGFRDVELFEIEDSFVFTGEPARGESARAVALRYIMGMYGMSGRFARAFDDLESIIRETLVYPELGEAPAFGPGFSYIPRRAVVARARKPAPDGPRPFSERDQALIRAIGAALETSRRVILRRAQAPAPIVTSWFGPGGARFGVSARKQRAWSVWTQAQRAAGLFA